MLGEAGAENRLKRREVIILADKKNDY